MRKPCANHTRSPYTSNDTASGASSASRIHGFACPTAHSATSVQPRCRLSVKAVPVQVLKHHLILIANVEMSATATDCSARGRTAHRPTSPMGLLAPVGVAVHSTPPINFRRHDVPGHGQRTTARPRPPAPLTASDTRRSLWRGHLYV